MSTDGFEWKERDPYNVRYIVVAGVDANDTLKLIKVDVNGNVKISPTDVANIADAIVKGIVKYLEEKSFVTREELLASLR